MFPRKLKNFCLILLLSGFCTLQAGIIPFKIDDIDNNAFDLKDHLGNKTILINFWATYCVPCLAEMVQFQKLYEKHKDSGFLLVAISIDKPQTIARVKTYIKSKKYTYPVLLDIEQKVANLYNISALPTSILIDHNGKIIRRTESYHEGEEAVWDSLVTLLIENKKEGDTTAVPQDKILTSDIDFIASNYLRTNYGREKRGDDFGASWFEDWFDFQAQKNKLAYKIRYRAYQFLRELPENHDVVVRNPNHRIVKHLLSYDGEYIKAQAGNIYTNIGRGLILRTFEDRNARIDKDMNGIRAGLNHPNLYFAGKSSISVFGGNVYDRFTDLYSLDADEANQRNTYLQGVEGSLSPLSFFKLSGHALKAVRDKLSRNSLLFGGSAQGNFRFIDYYLGVVSGNGEDKYDYPHEFNAKALYASLSLTLNKLALGGEYKFYDNYDYDFTDPPNLLKFHTFRLMARNLVISNNQREEGFQFNGTYHFKKNLSYGLNVSYLKAHPERNNIDMVFHKQLPFWDIDQLLRLPITDNSRLLLELNFNRHKAFKRELDYPSGMASNVFNNKQLADFSPGFKDINAYTLGALFDHKLNENYAFQAETEYQFQQIDLNEYLPPPNFAKRGDEGQTYFQDTVHHGVILLSLVRISKWSVTVDFEVTTSRAEEDPESVFKRYSRIRNGWSSVYFTCEFLKKHKATLWVGQRKERVICSGGTCRVEPGFEGVEFILNSYL